MSSLEIEPRAYIFVSHKTKTTSFLAIKSKSILLRVLEIRCSWLNHFVNIYFSLRELIYIHADKDRLHMPNYEKEKQNDNNLEKQI